MRDDMKSEIVKEILIDAPVAKVWLHLTDPKRIAGWLMPNDFELRVGRAFSMECKEGGKDACVVKEIVPEKKLVYTWQSEQTKVETLVTITLTAEGQGTRVKLVHSGWDQLPPADRDVMGGHDRGWTEVLEKLRAQVAGVKGAAR
jgi:uncharacterized protein YndB with AHSA1/START domain